ncbi:MAG: hypothetical protein KDC00_08395 [Flavobacteriales bacterium]|nr:hypothetical protein [Flavobacteriales bacterium]
MDTSFLLFLHSLLRYAVLITVAGAGLMHLRGFIGQHPILNGERTLAIVAMVLCHVQLVLGLILYAMNYETYEHMRGTIGRFWKMEHLGTMVIAILLVTLGRMLSKRAKVERSKQLRVAVFYLIALALILWAIPWPGTEVGHGRGWL